MSVYGRPRTRTQRERDRSESAAGSATNSNVETCMAVFTNKAERGAGDERVTSGIQVVHISIAMSNRNGIKLQSHVINDF